MLAAQASDGDSQENGIYKIIGMKAGGPADRAFPALQNGDAILSIDDEPIAGKSKQELIDLFKGPAGSQVSLEIRYQSDMYTTSPNLS